MNLIRRNIDVFDEQYPRLEKYAKNAESCIDSGEYNLCMIYLGRIAEVITRILCRRSNIPCDNDESDLTQKLFEHGQVTPNIRQKIDAISELHYDASHDGYNSRVSCTRMYEAAVQVCEWFISVQRFDFLKNLKTPEMYENTHYPFSKLARLGRDTDNNLYPLTRYGLLCLGNMGEEVCMLLTFRFIDMITADRVREFMRADEFNGRDINLRNIADELGRDNPDKKQIAHRVRKLEQALRIKFLFHCGIIGEEQKRILQNMLAPRNGAVHGEIEINGDTITYYTKRHEKHNMNAKRLLNDAQSLCVWLFRKFIHAGCIIRGRIETMSGSNIRVSCGPVYGFVSRENIHEGHECETGKIYPFDVVSVEGSRINLGMTWMMIARRYREYHNGQEVRAVVVSIEEGHGVNVEITDGQDEQEQWLGAFIPSFELGDITLSEGQEINAKVNGFSMGRPYMFLTMKDVEQENEEPVAEPVVEPVVEPVNEPAAAEPESESESITEEEKNELQRRFLRLCMSGTEEEISRAISAGVNINVRNRTQATALMFAAQKNTADAVDILINAGLDIDAQDIHGNTALIYAASYNNDDVVDMLIGRGAEVNIMNHIGYKALVFAKRNYRLQDTDALRVLEEQTKD